MCVWGFRRLPSCFHWGLGTVAYHQMCLTSPSHTAVFTPFDPAPFDQYYCLKVINSKLSFVCVCVLLNTSVLLWANTIDSFVLLTGLITLAFIPAGMDDDQYLCEALSPTSHRCQAAGHQFDKSSSLLHQNRNSAMSVKHYEL